MTSSSLLDEMTDLDIYINHHILPGVGHLIFLLDKVAMSGAVVEDSSARRTNTKLRSVAMYEVSQPSDYLARQLNGM